MYSPVQDGIEKTVRYVQYREIKPCAEYSRYVDCFWELKTIRELSEDFCLHALPDACVNILLNQLDTDVAGITALQTTYETLNLGRNFHYVGVQLIPGVWKGNRDEIADSYVGSPYLGKLPLIKVNNQILNLELSSKKEVLSILIKDLVKKGIIVENPVVNKILDHIESISSVKEMAECVNYSSRQLQRMLQETIGFSPHNLLKVLRLQQSIKDDRFLKYYSDQSHFIRAFQKATGYTPVRYFEKYDV